jgi:hypothetical protein
MHSPRAIVQRVGLLALSCIAAHSELNAQVRCDRLHEKATVFRFDSVGQTTFFGDVYQRAAPRDQPELSFGGWGDHYYDYFWVPRPEPRFGGGVLCIFVTSLPPNDPQLRLAVISGQWDARLLSALQHPPGLDIEPIGRLSAGWNAINLAAAMHSLRFGYGVLLSPTFNDQSNGSFASAANPNPLIRPFVLWLDSLDAATYASIDTTSANVASPSAVGTLRALYDKQREEWALGSEGRTVATMSVRIANRLLIDAIKDSRLPSPQHRASFTSSDWADSLTLAKVGDEPQLFFAAPSLRSDSLTVNGLLGAGEVVRVLGERERPVLLENPFNRGPFDSGIWLRIGTLDGRTGWLFAAPQGEKRLATILARQPAVREGPKDQIGDGVTLGILLGVALVALLVFGSSLTETKGSTTGTNAISSQADNHYRNIRDEPVDDDRRSNAGQQADDGREERKQLPGAAIPGSRVYSKTGWFSEEEAGRVDDDGRTFRKTGIFSEDETGRVDEDGRVYEKTGWFTEEQTHRIDESGTIYKKTGWFSEEEVGRIDSNGTVYEKTGWFSEEQVGRIEKDDDANRPCLISTACVRAAGLHDDCEQLRVLRNFRDHYVLARPAGNVLVDAYYRMAPRIIVEIDSSSESEKRYVELYHNLVERSVTLIRAGRFDDALENYVSIVRDLAGAQSGELCTAPDGFVTRASPVVNDTDGDAAGAVPGCES